VLYSNAIADANLDVWAVPVDGSAKPFAVVQTPRPDRDAQFSPDGRWVAYVSQESGRAAVYVRPFLPGQAGAESSETRWMIPDSVGNPGWLNHGRQLYYVAIGTNPSQRRVMVVDVLGGPGFQWGPARLLHDIPAADAYDITQDGKRILAGFSTETASASPPINVVLNWHAGLEN
jgi:Tol biopolymer transport system component